MVTADRLGRTIPNRHNDIAQAPHLGPPLSDQSRPTRGDGGLSNQPSRRLPVSGRGPLPNQRSIPQVAAGDRSSGSSLHQGRPQARAASGDVLRQARPSSAPTRDAFVGPKSFAEAVSGQKEYSLLFPPLKFARRQYGLKDGKPSVAFSSNELEAVSGRLSNALIAKFPTGRRPPIHELRKFFLESWNLHSKASVAYYGFRHVLIVYTTAEDATLALTNPSKQINNSFFRLFRWTPDFHPKRETTRISVWVRLPDMPLRVYHPEMVEGIVSFFGVFLDVDAKTKNMEDPDCARACVEVDINDDLPSEIWVDLPFGKGYWQAIVYEGKMRYCSKCKMHGHDLAVCRRRKNSQEVPVPSSKDHVAASRESDVAPSVVQPVPTDGLQSHSSTAEPIAAASIVRQPNAAASTARPPQVSHVAPTRSAAASQEWIPVRSRNRRRVSSSSNQLHSNSGTTTHPADPVDEVPGTVSSAAPQTVSSLNQEENDISHSSPVVPKDDSHISVEELAMERRKEASPVMDLSALQNRFKVLSDLQDALDFSAPRHNPVSLNASASPVKPTTYKPTASKSDDFIGTKLFSSDLDASDDDGEDDDLYNQDRWIALENARRNAPKQL